MSRQTRSPLPQPDVPEDVGSAIWHAARDALVAGAPIFTTTVRVDTIVGAAIKVSAAEPTSVERVSPDRLLASVEALGWRLESVSHVYVQTTTSTNAGFAGMSVAGISGYVQAHYLFRRT